MPIEYSQRERSYELFVTGKRAGTWDPDEFDLSQDCEDWATFSEGERRAFLASMAAFYDGEEDVTRTLAPYMVALDRLDPESVAFDPVQEEMYLSQQLYEEAKHTDLFSRYFEEVFGTQDTAPLRVGGYQEDGYSTENLYDTADDLLAAARSGDGDRLVYSLGEAYLNYMGIVEAQLARSGYIGFDMMAESKARQLGRDRVLPAFQDAIARVRQDESRHIENGRWVLARLADTHPDIVADVYEPRLREYVENRMVNATPLENPFEGYDPGRIGSRAKRFLQDTVDAIGAERFTELDDVGAYLDRQLDEAAAD